jgi:hypothetical protein
MTPHELLKLAGDVIAERGANYGGIEDNFQLIADLSSLRLGRNFHPYEIAVIMACVKNARAFSSPDHLDSHVDAMNYEMFAATFADNYMAWFATTFEGGSEVIGYQKKADRKPAKVSKPTRAAKLPVVSDKLSELTSFRETSEFSRGA